SGRRARGTAGGDAATRKPRALNASSAHPADQPFSERLPGTISRHGVAWVWQKMQPTAVNHDVVAGTGIHARAAQVGNYHVVAGAGTEDHGVRNAAGVDQVITRQAIDNDLVGGKRAQALAIHKHVYLAQRRGQEADGVVAIGADDNQLAL